MTGKHTVENLDLAVLAFLPAGQVVELQDGVPVVDILG